jgi:hypothetical protein
MICPSPPRAFYARTCFREVLCETFVSFVVMLFRPSSRRFPNARTRMSSGFHWDLHNRQHAQNRMNSGCPSLCKNHAAQLSRQGPVDELHLIENKGVIGAFFSLTLFLGSVDSASFFDIFLVVRLVARPGLKPDHRRERLNAGSGPLTSRCHPGRELG